MTKFCDKCGSKLKDNAKFCDKCGSEVKFTPNTQNTSNTPNIPIQVEEKSMAIAMIISFFLTGLGLCYAGNTEKGLMIFLVSIIVSILSIFIFKHRIFSLINIGIWIVGLILTYQEVENVNQQKRMMLMNYNQSM